MSTLDDIKKGIEACRTYSFGMRHADKLAHEDADKLVAALEAVEKLAEDWRYKGEFGWGAWQEGYGPDPEGHILDAAAGDIRKAITEALR